MPSKLFLVEKILSAELNAVPHGHSMLNNRIFKSLKGVVPQHVHRGPKVKKGYLKDLWVCFLVNGVEYNLIHRKAPQILKGLC